MGLFDRLRKKTTPVTDPDPSSTTVELLDKATALYNSGEYTDALKIVSEGFQAPIDQRPLYELASAALKKLGGAEEAALFDAALQQPANPAPFHALADHFFNEDNYKLSVAFYEKTADMRPGDTMVVHDLALSHARSFQIEKALKTLESVDVKNDFWMLWFWCKLRIFVDRPEGVQNEIDNLQRSLHGAPEDELLLNAKRLLLELQEMLDRYNAVGKPDQHIQHWHFIQYGSAILDFFETDDFVAGGRYVALWGNNESLRHVCERLVHYLHNAGMQFCTVHYAEGRDSEIIARLVAADLGLPCSELDPETSPAHSLIVAANTSDLNYYPALVDIAEGQLVFALNHSWLANALLCPDIIGLMSQSYFFPWSGQGFRMNEEKGTTEPIERDDREAAIIAAELSQLKGESDSPDKSAFYNSVQNHLKGTGTLASRKRSNFMRESPVPGSYFA